MTRKLPNPIPQGPGPEPPPSPPPRPLPIWDFRFRNHQAQKRDQETAQMCETIEAILKMADAMNRQTESILRLTEVLLNPPEKDEPDEHASGYLSG